MTPRLATMIRHARRLLARLLTHTPLTIPEHQANVLVDCVWKSCICLKASSSPSNIPIIINTTYSKPTFEHLTATVLYASLQPPSSRALTVQSITYLLNPTVGSDIIITTSRRHHHHHHQRGGRSIKSHHHHPLSLRRPRFPQKQRVSPFF